MSNYLYHYGVKGQKKGNRRYQYEDKSLTPEGRIHYGVGPARGTSVRNLSQDEIVDNIINGEGRYVSKSKNPTWQDPAIVRYAAQAGKKYGAKKGMKEKAGLATAAGVGTAIGALNRTGSVIPSVAGGVGGALGLMGFGAYEGAKKGQDLGRRFGEDAYNMSRYGLFDADVKSAKEFNERYGDMLKGYIDSLSDIDVNELYNPPKRTAETDDKPHVKATVYFVKDPDQK